MHVLGQVSSAFTDSIEFNQGSNLFAVDRVTQKIKFYDYYYVIENIGQNMFCAKFFRSIRSKCGVSISVPLPLTC